MSTKESKSELFLSFFLSFFHLFIYYLNWFYFVVFIFFYFLEKHSAQMHILIKFQSQNTNEQKKKLKNILKKKKNKRRRKEKVKFYLFLNKINLNKIKRFREDFFLSRCFEKINRRTRSQSMSLRFIYFFSWLSWILIRALVFELCRVRVLQVPHFFLFLFSKLKDSNITRSSLKFFILFQKKTN